MTYEEFLIIIFNNMELFITSLIASIVIYFLVLKRYIYSFIDPFLYHVITSASGFSVIFVLWILKYIDDYYCYSFLITQISFILGIYVFKPVKLIKTDKVNYKVCKLPIYINILYILSGVLFILVNYLLYLFKGIPLFMSSRLEAGIGGFGILLSVIYVTQIIVITIFLIKFFILRNKLSSLDIFFMANIIIATLLSGSRSGILGFIFVSFYVFFFFANKFNLNIFAKYKVKFIFIMALTVLISLILFYVTTKSNPFSAMFFRLVMTGDIYMMAYVNDNINIIEGNFIEHFLYPVLAGFKLISWEYLPKSIGQQILNYIYSTDIVAGPNARMNIVALKFFGFWGGIFYAFIIGLLISFIRNKLIHLIKKSYFGLFIYLFISIPCLSLETDIFHGIFQYKSIFVISTPLFIISFIISDLVKHKKTFIGLELRHEGNK